MSASATKPYRFETRLVHSGTLRSQFAETSEALFLTQGYVYEKAPVQAEKRFKGERAGLPVFAFLEPDGGDVRERMCALEGAQAARATATGMAARQHRAHGAIARRRPCRGRQGAFQLPAAISSTSICRATASPRRWWKAPTSRNGATRCGRTPRPSFSRARPIRLAKVIDIAEVAKIAHAAGATLVVGSVFSTPLWQRPLELGADFASGVFKPPSISTARATAWAASSSPPAEDFIQKHVHTLLRQTGPSISPFNAWVLLKGLETLSVRVQRQTDTAATVAVALAEHPKISRLIYPGRTDHPQAAVAQADAGTDSGAGRLRGQGRQGGRVPFQDALKLVRISNNLGDAKSLITHPATTTHQRLTPAQRAELGISDGFLRLSAGLEHPDDLVEDIMAGLDAV